MAKPAYMEDNDAALARLIKDGAVFIRNVGSPAPNGTSWVPGAGDDMLGYYSDDGYTLVPVPGDETNLTGHNGDMLISESAPGWWTVGLAALEGNETVTSTYFDVNVAPDGSVTVSSAAASSRYDLITVGMDQKGRLILVHFPNVQVDNSSREGLTFNRTTLLASALTFKTFKGGPAAPYHFKAWGLVAESDVVSATAWTTQITGTPTGGTFRLIVDGAPTPAIAHDAANGAYDTAINGLSGVTGVTVATTGTATKTLTFSGAVSVQADASSLTGGTSPAVTVAKV